MPKFRKIPVVISAEQWFPGVVIEGVTSHPNLPNMGLIRTLEDTDDSAHHVSPGDWVITGVEGEKYACKPSVFDRTYEPAD